MRKKLAFIPLLSLVLSGCGEYTPQENHGPVDVIILTGQSNAVGYTYSTYLLDSIGYEKTYEYYLGYQGIGICYNNWEKNDLDQMFHTYDSLNDSVYFVPVRLGEGYEEDAFGPEIGIAESLSKDCSNKVFIIKFACGSSSLHEDWARRFCPLYPLLIDFVYQKMKLLSNYGYEPTVKAMCWMQGESDANSQWHTETYLSNLENFVSNVRSDLKYLSNGIEIPFIDAKISNAHQWQYANEVNSAKEQFALESDNNYLM